MFLRALTAFIALPGLFAFVIPIAWLWSTDRLAIEHPWGMIYLAVGIIGLFWCVRDFYVAGKGTLAPWAPPKNLVVVGLYRYSRNPMYVSVVLILLGWALTFGSTALLVYSLGLATAFHLRVLFGEEPWLRRTHGAAWDDYAGRVRRWF